MLVLPPIGAGIAYASVDTLLPIRASSVCASTVASNAAGIIDWGRMMGSMCFGGGVKLVVYRVQWVAEVVK